MTSSLWSGHRVVLPINSFSRFDRASGPCLPSPRSRWGLWPVLWGSVIFGHFGDKIGRKKVTHPDAQIVGIATVAISLIPLPNQPSASGRPYCSSCARLAQGIGLGGEWGPGRYSCPSNRPPTTCLLCQPAPDTGMSVDSCSPPGVLGLPQPMHHRQKPS